MVSLAKGLCRRQKGRTPKLFPRCSFGFITETCYGRLRTWVTSRNARLCNHKLCDTSCRCSHVLSLRMLQMFFRELASIFHAFEIKQGQGKAYTIITKSINLLSHNKGCPFKSRLSNLSNFIGKISSAHFEQRNSNLLYSLRTLRPLKDNTFHYSIPHIY